MRGASGPSENSTVKIFVSDAAGPDQFVGFFEDDGETGYLYVSDRGKGEIIRHLQIYVDSCKLDVQERDVQVVWSADGQKCGVLIWGGMRGIIDLGRGVEGRALLTSRDTPPVRDPEWLHGFGLHIDEGR